MNLDPTAPRLLSRDDIINILSERHLKIQSMDSMDYEELLRIYETFAQPLEKRHTKRSPGSIATTHPSSLDQSKILLENKSQDQSNFKHRSESYLDCPPTKYLKLSFNAIASVAKKRSNGILMNAAQECTPPKRKPITWP